MSQREDSVMRDASVTQENVTRDDLQAHIQEIRDVLRALYPGLKMIVADRLVAEFPDMDVAREIRRAHSWHEDHPSRVDSHKSRFLRGWMHRVEAYGRGEPDPRRAGWHRRRPSG